MDPLNPAPEADLELTRKEQAFNEEYVNRTGMLYLRLFTIEFVILYL